MLQWKPEFRFLNKKAGIILLGLLFLGGCNAVREETSRGKPELSLPPITDEATREHHPGKFIWHDLLTTDEIAAQTFYGELFGWSFRAIGNYIEIYNGERKIGGILTIQPKTGRETPAHWLASMSATDIDRAAEQVRSSGGKVINGPMHLGERGRGVLIADPSGAQLLLLHTTGGDPRDQEPGVGDWLWNEVWTLDPEPLVNFYKDLGQYEETLKGDDYVVLINEGRWRAGVRTIKQEAYAGRWVPVVRVKDPAALLDRVRQLGGTVLLAPGEKDASADTALISDNRGAMLILQRWTFPDEKEAR